jgi:hypothetical protein
MNGSKAGICELCERKQPLTFHHLIPRHLHSKKKFRNKFSLEEMRKRGLNICKLCHDGLHDLFTEKELGEFYYTKELLIAQENIAKHIVWVRKQK